MRCPTEAVLERLLTGELSAAEDARVRAHTADCPSCATWMRDAVADEELLGPLGGLLRDDHPALPSEIGDGRYRVIGPLGEGGMGVVWEAEQQRPRRRVALKVLRPGLLTRRAKERFTLESEVLGRLDHAGIARVLEAGTFGARGAEQPFFAMELVRGRPLDRFAREEGLDLRARLALLARVADAVEHAHQRGVIHRDLKPSNVLVTDAGEPKVLDFGVARLLVPAGEEGVTVDHLVSRAHEVVGTLPFMAPEVLAATPDTVDTRADVYALGAMLYLLCGDRLPIDVSGVALAEGARRVAEQRPKRLGAIDGSLAGDVETIAARALEKEPERRYASAAALADDLRRVLAHEPIQARPPSAVYVLSRFARRHRAVTALALGLVVALATGFGLATQQAVRASRAEAAVRAEAARLAAVNTLLNDLLGAADPLEGGLGANATIRQALHDAELRLERDSVDLGPDVESELRLTLAAAYRGLGELDHARKHLGHASRLAGPGTGPGTGPGIGNEARARIASEEAALAYAEGDYHAAEDGFQRALDLWREAGLSHDRRALAARTHLGAARLERGDRTGARQALELSFAEADALEQHEVAAGALVFTARVHAADGDPTAARAAIVQALDLFEVGDAADSNLAAHAWSHLGILAAAENDFAAAADAARHALTVREHRFGVDNVRTANDLTNLGTALAAAGAPEEALPYHERAIALVRDARKLNLAASCLDRLGRAEEAAVLHAEAYELALDLDVWDRGAAGAAMGWAAVAAHSGSREDQDEAYRLIAERMPPEEHPRWAVRSRVEVGRAHQRGGDPDAAAVSYRSALALPFDRAVDPLHIDKARLYLGMILKEESPGEAAPLFEGLLADAAEEPGVQELAATHLGWIRLDAGDAEAGERLHRQAVDGFTALVGAESETVLQARRNLACALFDLGRTEEAREHFEAAAAVLGPELGTTGPRSEAILARFRACGGS